MEYVWLKNKDEKMYWREKSWESSLNSLSFMSNPNAKTLLSKPGLFSFYQSKWADF